MRIITIGGLPAAGKTYTSNILAKELNCLAIEVESLRWNYFNENPRNNMFYYTNNEGVKEQESLRDYYLRCTLYDKKTNLDMLISWHKKTVEFIDKQINLIFKVIKNIKTKEDYIEFCDKYGDILNYAPEFENFNNKILIVSHAFINVMEFSKSAYLKIDFDSDYRILKKRFLERETIKDGRSLALDDYYKSYREILKDSNAIKMDIIKKDVPSEIRMLMKKYKI